MDTEKLNLPFKLEKIREYWQYIVTVLFLLIIFWSSIFQISTEEVGVITRFGKDVRQVEPGLNSYMPFV